VQCLARQHVPYVALHAWCLQVSAATYSWSFALLLQSQPCLLLEQLWFSSCLDSVTRGGNGIGLETQFWGKINFKLLERKPPINMTVTWKKHIVIGGHHKSRKIHLLSVTFATFAKTPLQEITCNFIDAKQLEEVKLSCVKLSL